MNGAKIAQEPSFRQICINCFRPSTFCYCPIGAKIDTRITFAILIHPIEVKRRIATGRMAHLCLANSLLIKGEDFSDDERVNSLINDPQNHCLMLYPGNNAIDLSDPNAPSLDERVFPDRKKTVLFVIDGTWRTARKTVRLSQNLRKLPTICFTPKSPSRFRVRRQPAPGCYSTIEAIHHILDLLWEPQNEDSRVPPHDLLLATFDRMVAQQLKFTEGRPGRQK